MSQREDALDAMLPTVISFCELVEEVATVQGGDDEEFEDDEEPWFVRQQLFGLARYLDFADEAGRRQLTQLLRE